MAAAMAAYTESLSVDARMVAEDIWGSQAHALMLAECGLLDPDELRDILTWLERARADFESGAFELRPELEDVHMNVERYVTEGAGAGAGGRLHTARSRNDQVLTDCRLYVRRRLLEVRAATLAIVEAMLARAATETETVMPGYTHSQHAQPITFGFWASAHASAWLRDLRRLAAAYDAVNRNPLGACALAGTDLPIDRGLTTDLLGFAGLAEHALDATSSRDFLLETTSALTLLMLGLSRLSEELVWWSSHEFRLIELDDAYTSGSSIMPQKK
ncbi:MAG TPA: argininosuccinate lyase, partial [Armatimonadetes bacterium]|nr:argininosuccinate lyase [Armatimonadota bacterium]